jgi:pyruvate dehydrogenase E2 component (dihydrolipoamide acetyltransferase)
MKEVIMPKFGFTQEEAEIVRWLAKPGTTVEKGQPIAEVTTDKVNMEVEAPESGLLGGVRYQEGEVVPVTAVICYILAPGEELKAGPSREEHSTHRPQDSAVTQKRGISREKPKIMITPLAARIAQEKEINPYPVPGTGLGGRVTRADLEAFLTPLEKSQKVNASPAARRLAREMDIELQGISGSGPNGRIQSKDVKVASVGIGPEIRSPILSQSYDTPVREIIQIVGMRRTIAERLQSSAQEAPHVTFDTSVDITAVESLLSKANAERKTDQKRVSLTAVITKITAWALERTPRLNAWIINNPKRQEIVVLDHVNIGIAVALKDGLIVPVVKDASHKGLLQISDEINKLVEQARNNRLHPAEIAQGTFTISNLGMFGVDRFTAIINSPQVAILAIGRAIKRIVPDEYDQPAVRFIMSVTLSADHRAIDGAVAAHFLSDLRSALEQPSIMML